MAHSCLCTISSDDGQTSSTATTSGRGSEVDGLLMQLGAEKSQK